MSAGLAVLPRDGKCVKSQIATRGGAIIGIDIDAAPPDVSSTAIGKAMITTGVMPLAERGLMHAYVAQYLDELDGRADKPVTEVRPEPEAKSKAEAEAGASEM